MSAGAISDGSMNPVGGVEGFWTNLLCRCWIHEPWGQGVKRDVGCLVQVPGPTYMVGAGSVSP